MNNPIGSKELLAQLDRLKNLVQDFAAREDRKDDPRIKKFIEIYRSQPVKDYINGNFKGSIQAAW